MIFKDRIASAYASGNYVESYKNENSRRRQVGQPERSPSRLHRNALFQPGAALFQHRAPPAEHKNADAVEHDHTAANRQIGVNHGFNIQRRALLSRA